MDCGILHNLPAKLYVVRVKITHGMRALKAGRKLHSCGFIVSICCYVNGPLTPSERRQLQGISCGSNFEDIERVESSVLMKILSSNSSPIEIPYYSTNHERLCYHCGGDSNFAEGDEYANKYPICNQCLSENKHPVDSRKRKRPTVS